MNLKLLKCNLLVCFPFFFGCFNEISKLVMRKLDRNARDSETEIDDGLKLENIQNINLLHIGCLKKQWSAGSCK